MGDAQGERLTVYERSVDFPPRSIGEDAQVSERAKPRKSPAVHHAACMMRSAMWVPRP